MTAMEIIEPFFGSLSRLYETGLVKQYDNLHTAIQGNSSSINAIIEGSQLSPEDTFLFEYVCDDRYTVWSLSVASICKEYLRLHPPEI